MKRMYVDPASQKTGYCITDSDKVIAGGAVQAKSPLKGELGCNDNINRLMNQYIDIFQEHAVDELYVEKVFGTTSYMVHRFVGVLSFVALSFGIDVKETIAVSSWQKGTDWKDGGRNLWKERGYESEDHYAATLIAEYDIMRRRA